MDKWNGTNLTTKSPNMKNVLKVNANNMSPSMKNALMVGFSFTCISLFILIMNAYGGSGILFTLYDSTSERRFLALSNQTNNIQKLKESIYHGQQFVTHGKWMPGKRHKPTCDFVPKAYGICGKNNRDIHFEFHDNRLNQIDAVADLKKILKKKKLLLIGDSLMTEFYFGLAELLKVKAADPKYRCRMNYTLHPENSGTLTHIRACLILLKGYEDFAASWDKLRIVPEENIRRLIAAHDIIVFNQGIHYDEYTLMCQGAIYFNNLGEMLHGKFSILFGCAFEFFPNVLLNSLSYFKKDQQFCVKPDGILVFH